MVDYAEYMDLRAKLEHTPGFFHYYRFAMEDLETRFSMLNEYFSLAGEQNPIVDIRTRLKTFDSIFEKLKRRGFPVTVQSITENLYDVAGVRVICSFIEDIYTIANMLTQQDDVTLLAVKDYIKNPKKNGYRSYHMIIEIPVFFSDKKQNIKVEVQIRTIAMDFWASLEHQVKYKKNVADAEEIQERLKKCAEVIAATDAEMQNIAQHIKII